MPAVNGKNPMPPDELLALTPDDFDEVVRLDFRGKAHTEALRHPDVLHRWAVHLIGHRCEIAGTILAGDADRAAGQAAGIWTAAHEAEYWATYARRIRFGTGVCEGLADLMRHAAYVRAEWVVDPYGATALMAGIVAHKRSSDAGGVDPEPYDEILWALVGSSPAEGLSAGWDAVGLVEAARGSLDRVRDAAFPSAHVQTP